MFYVFYKEKVNIDFIDNIENKKIIDNQININVKDKDNDKDCLLCLENNNEIFYDYNFKNNQYIHNCDCTPNIHYECFKKHYKKKKNCIICLKNIDKLYEFNDSCNYYILFKLSKFKFLLLLFIFFLGFYNLLKDIDLLEIPNLSKNDLFLDDIP